MPVVPTDESIRVAMEEAWRDHHHARDQTWKALQPGDAVVRRGYNPKSASFSATY